MKTIRVNGSTYELTGTTGKVLSAGKNMETKVSGSGGGGATFRGTGGNSNVRITSKTVVHDQIFLHGFDGREYAFQLSDFNIACREGNLLTVVFANKMGKTKGYDISVINHTTGSIFFDTPTVNKLSSPNKFVLGLIFIALCFLGFNTMGSSFLIIAGIILVCMLAYFFIMVSKNTKKIKASIRENDYKQEVDHLAGGL